PPCGGPDARVVGPIRVGPGARVLGGGGAQQLRVFARMSDGSTRDVTRMTQFEVNQPDMAGVSDAGLVTFARLPGRVAVMARFQTHVDVFRATLPLGAPLDKMPDAKT